jgi:hypothetical protein
MYSAGPAEPAIGGGQKKRYKDPITRRHRQLARLQLGEQASMKGTSGLLHMNFGLLIR